MQWFDHCELGRPGEFTLRLPDRRLRVNSFRSSGGEINPTDSPGRLMVVGTGITAVSQLTLETVAWIEAADVVCYVLADPLTERWIRSHAKASEDLARLHRAGVPRIDAYRAMSDRLVGHARDGKLVVGVFYGHPGVFTSPSHWAVAAAKAAGIPARMLPAVSAEDCLFADLGIDPGDGAGQSFEATDMLIRGRVPATDAHLIVWQIGVVAQLQLTTGGGHIAELVRYLGRFYPDDHVVTHYQAAQSVATDPTIQPVPLAELASLPLAVTSTLYVPPLRQRDFDMELAAAVDLDGTMPERTAETGSGDGADWYRPLSGRPSRLGDLITSLSTDPSLLDAVRADPPAYLAALGLDVIEAWAFLSRNQAWISACVREGSGPAAAVALGAASDEDEARTFFVHRDGRLVRRKLPAG
jgi:precorrin-4 methylase